jgi:tetratricopeptide (TPR) repeat protein
MIIKFVLRIIYRIFMMLFEGERFKVIKVAYLVDVGNYFHVKKNVDKTIRYYQKALRVDPEDYYANIGLAGALVLNKSFKESLDFFKKANSLKKPDIVTLTLMFVTYQALGEEKLQEEKLKDIKIFFNNSEAAAYERLAYTFFDLGMYDEAEYYLKEILKNYPNEGGPYYNLGKVHFTQEKFEEAREEFQKALKLAIGRDEKRLKKYVAYYIKRIDRKTN